MHAHFPAVSTGVMSDITKFIEGLVPNAQCLNSGSICSLVVALFLFKIWLTIRPSNRIISRAPFEPGFHLMCKYTYFFKGYLLTADSFSGRYAWLFMGLHMLWCANLELALELSSALSCINVWKECFFLSDPLLGRGRLWDVWSSSCLHELLMNSYTGELLMKFSLSCFQVVVVSPLWCCTPSVVAYCPCAVFLSHWGDSPVALSPSLLCQVLCQRFTIKLSLGCNLKRHLGMGGLLFEKRMMNSLYGEIWIPTGLCQGLWIFPTHTFLPLQEIIFILVEYDSWLNYIYTAVEALSDCLPWTGATHFLQSLFPCC